jgi:C1A family cysteine protease
MKKLISEKFYASAMPVILLVVAAIMTMSGVVLAEPPSSYDLRDVDGDTLVTRVKSQSGGTCWAFGAYGSVESNLMFSGLWTAAGDTGEPNLAEYHLDWWNGFNDFFNADDSPPSGGVEIHWGGNYHMTTAYLSRGEGAVRDIDGQSFVNPPDRFNPTYHYYYVRDVEWYTAGENLENINLIKEKIMDHGIVSTCLTIDDQFMSASFVHYQPPDNPMPLNHAVGIAGWDDNKITQAPLPGAWLCKNSWGSSWGLAGYFWISYYDKYCCQQPDLGATSFYNVVPSDWDKFFYHDYHGWVSTRADISEAFNAFTPDSDALLTAVNFVTSQHDVDFTVAIFDRFENGALLDQITSVSGHIDYTGFHTVDLEEQLVMKAGDDFYIYLMLSSGGQAYDCTDRSPRVTVGGAMRGAVISVAEPGQSYYRQDTTWHDLYDFNSTANFCIKGLAKSFSIIEEKPTIGHVGEPYEYHFPSLGGTEPLHWTWISGQLPYGCQFNGDTIGSLTGIPTWASTFNVKVELADSDDPVKLDTTIFEFEIREPPPKCGDANGDDVIQISDAVYMINFIFLGGQQPDPFECGDVNCDGKISLTDIIYMINTVFKGGYAPCDPNGDGVQDCMNDY